MPTLLAPNAFIDADELRSYLNRANRQSEDNYDDRAAVAINAATAFMEQWTQRRLRARAYTIPTTGSDVELKPEGDNMTHLYSASGAFAYAHVGDDVRPSVDGTIPYGQRITSILDATEAVCSLEMDSDAYSDPQVVTFGSAPLYLDGSGSNALFISEWPVQQVYSVATRDGVTWWDADKEIAATTSFMVEFNAAWFPTGNKNVRVECRCGYEKPSAGAAGSDEWDQLRHVSFRLAEIFYLDGTSLRGRISSTNVGQTSSQISGFDMPTDVLAWLAPFRRAA